MRVYNVSVGASQHFSQISLWQRSAWSLLWSEMAVSCKTITHLFNNLPLSSRLFHTGVKLCWLAHGWLWTTCPRLCTAAEPIVSEDKCLTDTTLLAVLHIITAVVSWSSVLRVLSSNMWLGHIHQLHFMFRKLWRHQARSSIKQSTVTRINTVITRCCSCYTDCWQPKSH